MDADSAVLDRPETDDKTKDFVDDRPTDPEGFDQGSQPDDQLDNEVVIEAGGQTSLLAGGEAPDQSTIVLRGGEVNLNGEFEKGSRLKFEIEGVVSEITFTDLMDQKTGEVTGTKRKHVLKIRGIQAVEA